MNRWSLTVCAMSALVLGSCSFFHGKGKPQEPAAAEEQAPVAKATVPTEAQQAAAHQLLEASDGGMGEEPGAGQEPLPAEPVASLPRSGLRLGQFAPPEEAASAGENAEPAPNSVELHGLRSPSLPSNLPMDINGKLTPSVPH